MPRRGRNSRPCRLAASAHPWRKERLHEYLAEAPFP